MFFSNFRVEFIGCAGNSTVTNPAESRFLLSAERS